MKNSCIIVAGGSGLRMGAELPKQFIAVNGMPLLMHTIRKFYTFDPSLRLIVVLPAEQIVFWKELCVQHNFGIPHQVTGGGATRFASVKNGLALARDSDLIAIHDGVRPLVSHATLTRCFSCAAEHGTAVPVLPASESVREGSMIESVPVDRSRYFMVQTPQVFEASILQQSYLQAWKPEFTDDASVVEHMGQPVNLVMGNRENIKITFPEDLLFAGFYLSSTSKL